MEGSAPVGRPWWLLFIFGVEALGWLLQGFFALIFSAVSTVGPSDPPVTAYLVFQLLVTLVAAGLFIRGMKPIEHSVGARFARVHAKVALLLAVPFLVLLVWQIAHPRGADWSGFAELALMWLGYLAVALAAYRGARSEKAGVRILAGVAAFVCVLVAAFFALGLGVGVSGLTV